MTDEYTAGCQAGTVPGTYGVGARAQGTLLMWALGPRYGIWTGVPVPSSLLGMPDTPSYCPGNARLPYCPGYARLPYCPRLKARAREGGRASKSILSG